MRAALIICIIFTTATSGTAKNEPLDKRFGPDREKGYRGEREYQRADPGFRNRDRANFLRLKHEPELQDLTPRVDLHRSPQVGLQK